MRQLLAARRQTGQAWTESKLTPACRAAVAILLLLSLSACEEKRPEAAGFDNSESWASLPTHFTNLQVLPETIERKALIRYMRTVSKSLGVRCRHCHDTKTEDYASDAIEAKVMARKMIRLVEGFNEVVGTRPDATAVTCSMCHEGETKPVPRSLPKRDS